MLRSIFLNLTLLADMSIQSIPYAHRVYPTEHTVTMNKEQLDALASSVYYTHVSQFFETIHWVNENVVLIPFRVFIHCKAFVERPFPGENKDAAPWRYTARKVAAFVGCVLTVLPAIASIILGLAIRAIEHGWRPLMCYMKNPEVTLKAKPIVLTEKSPLHIATLNVALVPSSVAIQQDVRSPVDRAREIVHSFATDSNRPAILTIEEGWNEDALKILCKGLRKYYPYILHSTAPGFLGMSSGAAVFSQYPFEDVKYVRFGKMVFTHSFPPRGFLRLHFKTAEGEPLYVYGSIHTQSMDGAEWASAREYQVGQLIRSMQEDKKNNPNCLQVALGDFNTSIVNLIGIDNRDLPENNVLKLMDENFDDLFLKDHDPVSGKRTQGEPHFLSDDNARLRNLPEPEATFADGPWSQPEERKALIKTLEKEQIEKKLRKIQFVEGKKWEKIPTWGTKAWFREQSFTHARYDYIMVPIGSELDGVVEHRRLFCRDVQSAPSDHALVSGLIWKKQKDEVINLN